MAQVATEGQRLFASRGLVQLIDDYLKRDKDEIADYYNGIDPRVRQPAIGSSPDGKTYYLPTEYNLMCIWYDADMFKQALPKEA